MTDAENTVFISYRRNVSSFIARAIFLDLRANGYDVFMDVESIDSGTFDTVILNQIEARGHFVLVLTPGSVERCLEADDWLRREIEYAMDKQRNIVPVLANGFTFNGTERYLTGKLSELYRYNALPLYHEYFDEAMARLRTRFLKQPVHGSLVVTPTQEQPLVEQKIEEVVKQPAPTEEELSVEAYFSRAYEKYKAGDLDGAIEDYTQIIRLHPKNAQMYIYRGMIHHRKGDFESAIADNSEAIRIDPQSAYAYNNRAEAYFALQQYDEAMDDFRRAYALGNDRMMIAGLAITNHALGRIDEALDLWQRLLEKNANFKDADWVGKELNWAQPLIEEARKLIAKL